MSKAGIVGGKPTSLAFSASRSFSLSLAHNPFLCLQHQHSCTSLTLYLLATDRNRTRFSFDGGGLLLLSVYFEKKNLKRYPGWPPTSGAASALGVLRLEV